MAHTKSKTGWIDVRLGRNSVRFEERADGAILVTPRQSLAPYPDRLTDRLVHWANAAPDRTFVAQRGPEGEWREISYAQALAHARSIATALIARDLSADRPVAIVSGNDLDHAMLALGCMVAGVPYAPISPSYSLMSADFSKLRYIMDKLTPGLVFASDQTMFGKAVASSVPENVERVWSKSGDDGTSFADLLATPAGPQADAAHAAAGPDTIAKFLFTSGSTGNPKGVITTQRMLSSNQVMIRSTFAFLADEPPVLLDWLPWNHVFGGSHNFGLVLFNGGTLYIDDGKPTPQGIAETVRNLREIAPTAYFNVPKGFEELVQIFRADEDLRKKFFSRLKLMFFAGAGIAPHVWQGLEDLSVQAIGAKVPILTGLGATETAPFALACDLEHAWAGRVGLPVPGVNVKMVPSGGKLEVRISAPSITPGYWREPELTAAAFDDEGFYKLGDALRLVDPADPAKGYAFDGRLNEDFKLSSGTWVSAGPLRAALLNAFAPLARDVIIAGLNRDDLAVLIFPDPAAMAQLAPGLGGAELAADARVRAAFAEKLTAAASAATGSSNRIARAIILTEAPDIDRGELTDKGTISQRAVLTNRAELVEKLYAKPYAPSVLIA